MSRFWMPRNNVHIWNKLNLPKMSLAYHAHPPHQQIPSLTYAWGGILCLLFKNGRDLTPPTRSKIPSTLREKGVKTLAQLCPVVWIRVVIFNFVMLLNWREFTSIFSQIWWYSKHGCTKFEAPHHIVGKFVTIFGNLFFSFFGGFFAILPEWVYGEHLVKCGDSSNGDFTNGVIIVILSSSIAPQPSMYALYTRCSRNPKLWILI